MIADVVDVDCFFTAVFESADDTANTGASCGGFAEVTGVGKDRLEELQGDDFLAVVFDLIDTGHTYILEDFEMFDIIIREGHPELGFLDAGNVLGEGFHFLVVHPVDRVASDTFGTGELLLHGHRRTFLESTVFPVSARSSHFADVDLRVEVCGKGLAVVATIDIDNIEVVDFVKVVLQSPRGKHIGNTWIKT